MISKKIKKGQLLVAKPSGMCDFSFNRSIILLADNNQDGTVGFILNKPLKYTLHDLVPDINADFTIYNGGPVEQENLYFIHNIPDIITNSIEISNGIYWGNNFEMTKILINKGTVKKDNIRFFLGYTGWDTNQLEDEIESNSWIAIENQYKKEIISKEATNFWKEKLKDLGGEYLLWANAPENPLWN
ncbi:MAG: YqgE/AlgH family protein [Flavobacteriaceae bacterium]|nr:YqgE/AlgH family protein [Flavobacteriaceae bacterium]